MEISLQNYMLMEKHGALKQFKHSNVAVSKKKVSLNVERFEVPTEV